VDPATSEIWQVVAPVVKVSADAAGAVNKTMVAPRMNFRNNIEQVPSPIFRRLRQYHESRTVAISGVFRVTGPGRP
jgi:hypothetical protein